MSGEFLDRSTLSAWDVTFALLSVVVALAGALADRGPDVLVTSELPSTMARTEER